MPFGLVSREVGVTPTLRSRTSVLTREAALHALAGMIGQGHRYSSRRVGLVLVYHDIARSSGNLNRFRTQPLGIDDLRAHFGYLRRRYDVVSVHELGERIAVRAPGKRFPVALTFDDDLENHLSLVAPLLSELHLPATFFLTGASLDGPCAFWWHDLRELFARGDEAWREVCQEVGCKWNWASSGVDLRMLEETITAMPPHERDSLALVLRDMVGSPPRDRGLSESAVRELVAGGFEIGFHTKRHYLLQTLDAKALHQAMREGADRLSAIAGRSLTAIAYPHGPGDLRIAAAAADAGFELGFEGPRYPVEATSHPMLLGRIDVSWRTSTGDFAFGLAHA